MLLFGCFAVAQAETVDLFTSAGNKAAYPVEDGKALAGRFNAAKQFNTLELNVAEAAADSGVTLSLYQWRGDYGESVTDKTRKLVKTEKLDVKAPGLLSFSFPIQKPGNYIWVASTLAGKSPVSLSGFDASVSPAQSYIGGDPGDEVEAHNGGGIPRNIGDTKGNAQTFTAVKPFNEIRVFSPTWNDETGTKGYTLSVYAWKTDYDTTVAASPLASGLITNFKDNAWVSLWFPTLPAGDYLWLADNPVKTPIGHWQDGNDIYPEGQAYLGGQETDGDFPTQIVYPASGTNAGLDFEARYVTAEEVGTIVLTKPVEDAVVTNNPPTVEWAALPNATKYTVQWTQDNNFGPESLQEASSTANSLTLPVPLDAGRWFWRVKGITATAESGFTSSSFQQTPPVPAAGGDVILEDFEHIDDWVERALTIESVEDIKHGGAKAMKVNFAGVHSFTAVDAPIGRLLPKNADGNNPTKVFIWTYVTEPVESVEALFNGAPGGGFTFPLTLDTANTWVKQEFDLTEGAGADPANTLTLFSLQRPPDFSGTAASVLFDDFGATYEKSANPSVLLGDLNADGKINVQDATLSLRIAVGTLTPTDAQKAAGDVNKDGKWNVQDTTLILRRGIGAVDKFPGE